MSPLNRFTGRVVLITGSSAGIGRQAALEFAKEGASVVIHGQHQQRLDGTEQMLQNEGIPPQRVLKVCGPLEREEVPNELLSQTIKRFGRLDVLINNAAAACKPGIVFKSGEDANSMENLDYLYAVNLRSIVQLLELALPQLERTGGNAINVSTSGALRPLPSAAFYCALKAALNSLTESYAQSWGPRGVRVNTVSPGPVETMIFERNGICGERKEQHKKWVAAATILGRYGQPHEVAAVLKFLASDEASFLCGANLLVDGGMAVKAAQIDVGKQE